MIKIASFFFMFSQLVLAAGQPTASGPAKVYEGPEGEVISVVEVNGGNEVVAKFEGVKGDLSGKVALLKVNDIGSGKQEYVYNKKKGSKTIEIPVMQGGQGYWRYLQPGVENWLDVRYSKTASGKLTAETLLKQYKP